MTILRGSSQFNRELLLEFRRSAIAFALTAFVVVGLISGSDLMNLLVSCLEVTILGLLTAGLHLLFVLFTGWRAQLFPLACLGVPVVVIYNTMMSHALELGKHQVLAWFALFVLASVLLRLLEQRLPPDTTLSRVALGTTGAFVLSCFVFRFVMGEHWRAWGNDGNTIGISGAAITTLFLGGFYWWRRHLRDSWLIFPVGNVITAPILLMLVLAENTVSRFGGIAGVNLWDFLWAAFFGLLGTWVLMLLKRYYVDKDRGALADAVRLRGVLVIFHALVPVFIFLFLLSCFQAFFARSKSDTAALEANLKAVAASALRAGTAVGTFKDQQVARVADVQTRVSHEFNKLSSEATNLLGGFRKDWHEFDDNVRAVAGKATDRAKAVAGEALDAVSDAIKLPAIPTIFGDFQIPDLGIGKAISKAFEGMFADIDFGSMFSSLVANMADDIESQFAGPIARAKYAEDLVKTSLTNASDEAKKQLASVEKEFKAMTTVLEAEKELALEHLKQSAVNIARLAYYVAILLVSFIICIVMYLLWRMMNGLVVMMERLTKGWKMVRTGEDPVPKPVVA